uniref:ATP-dependent zinc metalloprotease FTSH 1, chloroplastic n=1 Tax=Tanacetum cinerariifolium TaxID=118510 RepID=A0A699JZL9_TANCI|nr:ATP-dependent zinc metalloprotease FTSH 1, chloroplastic [Tanacetum cinerariifolium]
MDEDVSLMGIDKACKKCHGKLRYEGGNGDSNSDVMDDDDVVINLSKEDANRDLHEEVKNRKECDEEQYGNKTKDNRFVLVQSNRLEKISSSDLGIEYGCDGSPLMERITEAAKTKVSVMGFGRVCSEVGAKGVAIVEETELFGHSSLDMVMTASLGCGNDERKQTLNELLTEMDDFLVDFGFIVLADANMPDNVLGSSMLRPGRLGMHLSVDKIDISHIKFNLNKKLFLGSLKDFVGSYLPDFKKEFSYRFMRFYKWKWCRGKKIAFRHLEMAIKEERRKDRCRRLFG